MTTPSLNPFQQQALEALKQQQDAYLAAVRAWRDASSGGLPDFGPMPEAPEFNAATFEEMPTPADLAEQSQLFMTRVMEEQQRFFASLNDILGRM